MSIELRLYVSGQTQSSVRAIGQISRLIDTELRGACELEVIDVLENPGRAGDEEIMATPVLMRVGDARYRLIGDLSNHRRVLRYLDLA